MRLPLCRRVDVSDERCCREMRAPGSPWREIETLVTWEWAGTIEKLPQAPKWGHGWEARSAEYIDRDWMLELSRRAFRLDRLHRDPEVAPGIADEFKRRWVNLALDDFRFFLVSDAESRFDVKLLWVGGERKAFCIMRREDWNEKKWRVDLIASAELGKGHGGAVLKAAVDSIAGGWGESPIPFLTVRAGTQEDNAAGMALYRSLGFTIVKRERTFHL